MLQPKKTKFRKAQKGRMKGFSQRGHRLSNGMFGIKSLDSKLLHLDKSKLQELPLHVI